MITLSAVSKRYGNATHAALDGVTLDIAEGDFAFLVGPSGSGKSTLVRLLLRDEKPTDGDIHVAGYHLNTMPGRQVPRLRQRIGCVFQDFRLLPRKTAGENIAFALTVIGRKQSEIRAAVPEALAQVGLEGKADRLPHELSGGEQQRVALARAIVNKPSLLLADEPTGNLDPVTSQDIMLLLERINATGTTVVMATHDTHLVDRARRRVIELDNGRVVRDHASSAYRADQA
ncbi:cell division ATP-binding protein FtsE [Lolliginicoccus levis]|uniref:cell division ATP-binding protein FtsE n=1 Tax=Lolliginicoccus levis TaxID=2919542 RepID=UPI00241EA888|nr:cell division ATP-binding protein FtsE [Lolliginicoccus levis]